MATIKPLQNKQDNFQKLVDYSSSIESLDSVDKNVPIRYSTPVPGLSGLQVRQVYRPPTLVSSPSDISDIVYNFSMMQNYPAKHVRIYTSSSSSDEENNNPVQTHFTSKKDQNDSFGDDMLLSELKNNKERSDVQESSFKDFLPTPNYAQTKAKPMRKALNYVGQRITKDLFNDKPRNNAKNSAKQTKNDNNNTKGQKVKTRKKTSKVPNTKPDKIKTKQKHTIERYKKVINDKESWYCPACNMDTMLAMRQCSKCELWYHEEYVGLTKDDLDIQHVT